MYDNHFHTNHLLLQLTDAGMMIYNKARKSRLELILTMIWNKTRVEVRMVQNLTMRTTTVSKKVMRMKRNSLTTMV